MLSAEKCMNTSFVVCIFTWCSKDRSCSCFIGESVATSEVIVYYANNTVLLRHLKQLSQNPVHCVRSYLLLQICVYLMFAGFYEVPCVFHHLMSFYKYSVICLTGRPFCIEKEACQDRCSVIGGWI